MLCMSSMPTCCTPGGCFTSDVPVLSSRLDFTVCSEFAQRLKHLVCQSCMQDRARCVKTSVRLFLRVSRLDAGSVHTYSGGFGQPRHEMDGGKRASTMNAWLRHITTNEHLYILQGHPVGDNSFVGVGGDLQCGSRCSHHSNTHCGCHRSPHGFHDYLAQGAPLVGFLL